VDGPKGTRRFRVSQRFHAPITYKVTVCDRCQRQADSETAGGACAFGGCDGTLTELDAVPLSVALEWRGEHVAAEGKVERLNAGLADTLLGGGD
jgi:hypothetical protein